MAKRRTSLVVVILSAIVIALALGTIFYITNGEPNPRYAKNPGTPESWQHNQENRTVVSPQEKSPRQEVVSIDFALCSKGSDSFGFGMGSTSFYFEGIKGGKCHFYMGTEIENPNWDGFLNYECMVPTNYKKDFAVNDNGGGLTFVKEFCSS